jgi:hypothetical protein
VGGLQRAGARGRTLARSVAEPALAREELAAIVDERDDGDRGMQQLRREARDQGEVIVGGAIGEPGVAKRLEPGGAREDRGRRARDLASLHAGVIGTGGGAIEDMGGRGSHACLSLCPAG